MGWEMGMGQGWGATACGGAGPGRGSPRPPIHMALPGPAQVIEKERPQLTECEEPSIYSPAFPREKWQRKRTQVKIRVRAPPLPPAERGSAPSPAPPEDLDPLLPLRSRPREPLVSAPASSIQVFPGSPSPQHPLHGVR